MNFFRLTHPEYETDMDQSRNNPLEWANRYIVPGVICPDCGSWGGRRRLFLPITDPILEKRLEKPPYPIPLDQWIILADAIVKSSHVSSDFHLRPGDELGNPTVKVKSSLISDFVFPWRGGILFTEKTWHVLAESEMSGYRAEVVEIVDRRGTTDHEQLLPRIYYLNVTGRIKSHTNLDRCTICGRIRINYPIELSEANWDGNDFIIDENYPDLIFVTERTCTILYNNNLRNYICKKISN